MDERYQKILEEIDPSARRAHLERTQATIEGRFMDIIADLGAQKRLRERHEKAGTEGVELEGLRKAESRLKLLADQMADELARVKKRLEEIKGAGVPKD